MNALRHSPTAQEVILHGRRWLEGLARLGYAARGIVYIIVGGLALLAALGQGGATTDSRGAVLKVLHNPGGWILVLVIAIGLLGHSVWRFCQTAVDADGLGHGYKAIAARIGMLISSAVHLLFAGWAGSVALGLATSRFGSGSNKSLVARLLSQPFGPWLVRILGVLLIGVGIAQFVKARTGSFERFLQWSSETRRKLILFCRIGLYARGIVFGITGGLIVYAAVKSDPSQAGGLREALEWLRSQPFGPWLLGTIAIGLVCFGIFSFVEAIYRSVRPRA